jgi:hypothetical protein
VDSRTSPLRFFAIEPDGCSPACANCDGFLMPRLILVFRGAGFPKEAGGRIIKPASVPASGKSDRSLQRLTNHARLHQSARRPPRVMRRGVSPFLHGVPLPAFRGHRGLPDRVCSPAALLGFSAFIPFAVFPHHRAIPPLSRRTQPACRLFDHPHRPFSSAAPMSPAVLVLVHQRRARGCPNPASGSRCSRRWSRTCAWRIRESCLRLSPLAGLRA